LTVLQRKIKSKMAKRDQFSLTLAERRRRTFSDTFKRDKVREIELGLVKISEVTRHYCVSNTSIYRWLRKFGVHKETSERIIVETMSDTRALRELKERIAELERLVGQKQIEVDFYQKMIDLAQEHYGIEIKKNYSSQPCDTSGSNEKNTPSA
jgi:transposase